MSRRTSNTSDEVDDDHDKAKLYEPQCFDGMSMRAAAGADTFASVLTLKRALRGLYGHHKSQNQHFSYQSCSLSQTRHGQALSQRHGGQKTSWLLSLPRGCPSSETCMSETLECAAGYDQGGRAVCSRKTNGGEMGSIKC
jgi:hypothetical protein